ncbi:hypothetical protein H310_10116 [Aphanomyces invadans]|uniref:Uncharacterized protein n=1 Tax=Aphanomyces invadans TaxID=157072 RepID=A0A024TRQ5_9STRA|nr:hypothetical protein H310_10116 [Aphanomyces invadans]ETV96825.1 hypothetical protein H310_10116 [Aphanomyces invadans]|eukprot:XP_008874602.1 hypothetical protein H310_10116 [Aphanomyces invadans]
MNPPPMTPREFLTSAQWACGGEYTCMRVTGDHIDLWEFHCCRLGVPVDAVERLRQQVVDAVRSQAEVAASWMVTVLRADDKFLVHVYKMPSLRLDGTGSVAPIDVLVYGAPRSNAHIKHVQWIHDRSPIEQHARAVAASVGRTEPFGEVILHCHTTYTSAEGVSIPRTELLEGLITNFFVWRQGTLHTGGNDDAILHGSTRHLVLLACKSLSIPVLFTPPCLEDAAHWDAAFVSSVVKVVVPVRAIYESNGEMARLLPSPPPILDTLRAAVRRLSDVEANPPPQ